MTTIRARSVICAVAIVDALASATSLRAQIGIGTWIKQQANAPEGGGMTMTVEACCNGGRRLTYRALGSDMVLTVESPFDGGDAPVMVGGKPTGETMGIKRVDDFHTETVLKINGKIFGTSKATISEDGKTLTIENEITSTVGGHSVGKYTEIWVLK